MVATSRSSWWVCICVLLSLTSAQRLSAAGIDFSLKMPAPVVGNELKARLRAHIAKAQDRDSLEALRDAAFLTELTDIDWHLRRMIDNGQSLAGFEEFGIIPRDDVTVEVDIKNFPFWAPLSDLVPKMIESQQDVDGLSSKLRDLGFEDEDFAALKAYLAKNDQKLAVRKANLPLLKYYAGIVRSERGATMEQAKSHRYRMWRSTHEVHRVWAEGLMNSLRPQAKRILESTLREVHLVRLIGPEPKAEEALSREMNYIRSDAYLKWIQDFEKEISQ